MQERWGVTYRWKKMFVDCWNEIKECHNQEPLIGSFHLSQDCVFFVFSFISLVHPKIFCPASCLHQGSIWSHCLNEEVLQLGLARTASIVGLLPDSHLYWRLHKRLHRAEVRAERKGRGLWKQAGLWERVSEAVSGSAFFQLMRKTFKRLWCAKLRSCSFLGGGGFPIFFPFLAINVLAEFFIKYFSHRYFTFYWGFQLIHGL